MAFNPCYNRLQIYKKNMICAIPARKKCFFSKKYLVVSKKNSNFAP